MKNSYHEQREKLKAKQVEINRRLSKLRNKFADDVAKVVLEHNLDALDFDLLKSEIIAISKKHADKINSDSNKKMRSSEKKS